MIYKISTQQQLKECVSYNPEIGEFLWLTRPRSHFRTNKSHEHFNKKWAGKRCGEIRKKKNMSTLRIRINGFEYQAHRLAWLYVYGEWPSKKLKHLDGDGLNNKITNLTDAYVEKVTRQKKSNVKGVDFHKFSGKWRARINSGKEQVYLGLFDSEAGAVRARLLAENTSEDEQGLKIKKGPKIKKGLKMSKKITMNGKQYEIGKLYAFSNDGVHWVYGALRLIAHANVFFSENSNKSFKFCELIDVSDLGEIEDSDIRLEDGVAYRFNYNSTGVGQVKALGIYSEAKKEFHNGLLSYNPSKAKNITRI